MLRATRVHLEFGLNLEYGAVTLYGRPFQISSSIQNSIFFSDFHKLKEPEQTALQHVQDRRSNSLSLGKSVDAPLPQPACRLV